MSCYIFICHLTVTKTKEKKISSKATLLYFLENIMSKIFVYFPRSIPIHPVMILNH